MNKELRFKHILNVAENESQIGVSQLTKELKVDRTTIFRDLQELVENGRIQFIKKGFYQKVVSIKDYFEKPVFERIKKKYNPEFLASYIPNTTTFFTKAQLKALERSISGIGIQTLFYENNKRLLENILVDLSFSSSYLEGNTYSQLDTEILIKYNEVAESKEKDETQMILNHKDVINYLIAYKKSATFKSKTIYEIHHILAKELLHDKDLGVLRTKIVEIGGSTYTPLATKHQLEEQFKIFLNKLQKISNPFEQSLFILVFIPYFQLFIDVNKRVSRMLCNLPLLKHNLPLLSFLGIQKKDYIVAVLAIYELNNPTLLAELYTQNYTQNIHRYIT